METLMMIMIMIMIVVVMVVVVYSRVGPIKSFMTNITETTLYRWYNLSNAFKHKYTHTDKNISKNAT
jgi:cell shape-determining protein MreC